MLAENFHPLLSFLVYFSTGLAYFIAFGFIYLWITPYAEIKLIRAGNSAVGIVFSGAMLGYAFPLARAIEQSESAVDLLVWASVALVIQIVVFLGLHLLIPDLSKKVVENHQAGAILLAALSIAVGILNAASMTI